MMDNITGKETKVLIMIHYRCYLHDDSHIRLFRLSDHGLVPPDKQGSEKCVAYDYSVHNTTVYFSSASTDVRQQEYLLSHIL